MVMVLFVLLALCVVFDIRERRVPNQIVLLGLVLALIVFPLASLQGADASLKDRFLGCLVGLGLFMPFYLLRAMGAGDVKLMAMIGAFVGVEQVLQIALYSLVAGGVLSLVFMVSRGVARQTLANVKYLVMDLVFKIHTGGKAQFQPLAHTTVRLPYAVAIATGTLYVMWRHVLA